MASFGTPNKLETEIVNAEKKETEDWNKKIQELESEYKIKLTELNAQKITYDKKVRAEGDAQKDILFAEGNLAISKAEAIKIKLEAQVLRSKGGQIFIAKEAAENLNITKIKLNSNMRNPLDFISLKNMLKLFTYADFNVRIHWFGYLSLGKYIEWFRYFKYFEYVKRIPNHISHSAKNMLRSRYLPDISLIIKHRLGLSRQNYIFFEGINKRDKLMYFFFKGLKSLKKTLAVSLIF